MNRQDYLEKLIRSYAGFYNIDRYDQADLPEEQRFDGEIIGEVRDIEAAFTPEMVRESGLPLVARAIFHQHSSRYVLVKKAELWNADCNEYLYIYSMPHLTKELYDRALEYTVNEGSKLVDPKRGHMYSYVSALFLADQVDDDALAALKRCRIHKNFLFSLHGWMDVHTAVVDITQEQVTANGAGRDKVKILKRLLHIKQKGGLFK